MYIVWALLRDVSSVKTRFFSTKNIQLFPSKSYRMLLLTELKNAKECDKKCVLEKKLQGLHSKPKVGENRYN
jgi:hypothetical protein